jgi:DNA-binding IclR family transcriptional regulator
MEEHGMKGVNKEWTTTYRVMRCLRDTRAALTVDELVRRTGSRRATVYQALYHLAQHRCVTKRYHQWTGLPSYTARPEHLDTRMRIIEERQSRARRRAKVIALPAKRAPGRPTLRVVERRA